MHTYILFILLILLSTTGCRSVLPTHETTQSQLSQITDGSYSLYLAEYDNNETYEFVVCDQTGQSNAPITPGQKLTAKDHLPEHCVPAFRSSKSSQVCEIFDYYRTNCSRREEIMEYCKRIVKNQHITDIPHNFHASECHLIYTYNTLNNCSAVVDYLSDTCLALKIKNEACLLSKSEYSPACIQEQHFASKRLPFLLHDITFDAQSMVALKTQHDFESYLINKENPHLQRIEAFITGGSFGMFAPEMASSLKSLIPAKRILTSGPKLFVKFGPQMSVRNIFAMTVQTKSVLTLEGRSAGNLINFYGYTHSGACLKSIIDQSPKPVFSRNTTFFTALKRSIVPFGAGMGVTSVLARSTSKQHPLVTIGAIATVPFVAAFMRNRHYKHLADHLEHFPDIITPSNISDIHYTSDISDISNEVPILPKVNSIPELLPILGRSLVVTGKTTLIGLDQFCMPKKQGNSYTAFCKPILDDPKEDLFPTESTHNIRNTIECHKHLTDN